MKCNRCIGGGVVVQEDTEIRCITCGTILCEEPNSITKRLLENIRNNPEMYEKRGPGRPRKQK